MPRKKNHATLEPADPQKSSAAQFLTYIASTAKERGAGSASADGKDPATP